MTQRFNNSLPDITIGTGFGTSSNIATDGFLSDCETFTLFGVAANTTTFAYSIQLSNDNGTWYTWTDGTSNIIPPGPGVCCTYGNPGARFIRLASAGALASPSTWHIQTSSYE